MKQIYALQTDEKNNILEPDDIQCDLDEDLDDEHYSVQAQEAPPCDQRKTGVNDSFISQRMSIFGNLGHRNGIIPHQTNAKLPPGVTKGGVWGAEHGKSHLNDR